MGIRISQDDLIQSVADALQYISYYHPADFIRSLARAYEVEQSPAAKDAIEQILGYQDEAKCQDECGIASRANGDPGGICDGVDIVPHRTDIHEIDTARIKLSYPGRHGVIVRSASRGSNACSSAIRPCSAQVYSVCRETPAVWLSSVTSPYVPLPPSN